jgi:hypothetical protein
MNRLACCALVPAAVRYPDLIFRVLGLLIHMLIFAAGHVLPLGLLIIGAEGLTVAVLAVLTVRQLGGWPRLVMGIS